MYASWNGVLSEKTSKSLPEGSQVWYQVTAVIGLESILSNERGAARIGGDCVGHDLVVPCVLQTSDALNGDIEAPWEGHVPVRMNIDPAEDPIGDRPHVCSFGQKGCQAHSYEESFRVSREEENEWKCSKIHAWGPK